MEIYPRINVYIHNPIAKWRNWKGTFAFIYCDAEIIMCRTIGAEKNGEERRTRTKYNIITA